MAGDPYPELPRAKRKRLISRAVLLGLLTTAVFMVLYYLLPLDRPRDTGTAVRPAQRNRPRRRPHRYLAPPTNSRTASSCTADTRPSLIERGRRGAPLNWRGIQKRRT
jgi:hypothetical protein